MDKPTRADAEQSLLKQGILNEKMTYSVNDMVLAYFAGACDAMDRVAAAMDAITNRKEQPRGDSRTPPDR